MRPGVPRCLKLECTCLASPVPIPIRVNRAATRSGQANPTKAQRLLADRARGKLNASRGLYRRISGTGPRSWLGCSSVPSGARTVTGAPVKRQTDSGGRCHGGPIAKRDPGTHSPRARPRSDGGRQSTYDSSLWNDVATGERVHFQSSA